MIRLRSASAALTACLSFVLAGCGAGIVPGSKTTTPATPTPLISLSTTSVTFAKTVYNTTSATTSVTISNVGSATLVFNSIVLGDTTDFAMTNTCPTSLAAQSSCILSLTFKPANSVQTGVSSDGTFSSAVTLTDNSNNVANAQQSITLSGIGTMAPDLAPQVTLTPTSLTFANTTVGAATASQTVTVTNSGNAVLNITDISLGDLQDYTLINSCGTTLAAAATCTLTVTFHPSTTGNLADTIILTDNANNVSNAQQSVPLSGTGVAAGVPIATLSTTTLSFPDTVVGQSAYLSFTLTNTGTANILVTSLGSTTSVFSVSGQTCTSGTYTSIAPTISCTFTIKFTPASTGISSLVYTFTDNSNGVTGSAQSVTFTGNGTSTTNSAVTLTPEPLNFPDTTVGNTSAALTATLTNGGTTTLTGITPALSTYATSKAFAISGTTCGTTLAAGASCAYSITFTPFTSGNYQAYLQVTDNATNSPQMIDIFANGVQATLTLTPTSFSFPVTKVGTTSSPYSATLTNTGGATANITSIKLGGVDPEQFAMTTTCGATLAGGASCTISTTFTPTGANTWDADVDITSSNATPASLTLSFFGPGTDSNITYNLYEWPDPGAGNAGTGINAALYSLLDNAQSTIDITMYALQDTTFSGKLVTACKRGVIVRAVLDQNGEKSNDTAAYNQLNAQANCSAVWANKAFSFTHEKTFVVDRATIALLSGNLQSQYYSTTRDYAMIYNDPIDANAIWKTFNMDFAAGTPPSGVAGASDFSYVPDNGEALIWSPTNAKQKMLDVINNATATLNVENEELASSASYIISAIAAQCQKGVSVRVLIENEGGDYTPGMTTLKNAGCGVHYYYSSSGFYIHAKDVVADYGLPTQASYMGSINYSNGSMTLNRELGMNITDQASVSLLYNTFVTDYNAAYVF